MDNKLTFILKKPFFVIRYIIFIFKYFNDPFSILLKHLHGKEIQSVILRNGKTFNSYGYGSTALSLYRIWGDYEYGIKPKDVANFNTVIDIGAHIGLFSVFLGYLNPECKILSFEMDENNYKNLKKNIKNCNVKNVFPFNCAVSEKSELINYYSGRGSSEFSIKKISFSDEKPLIDENKKNVDQIKSVTLNDIIEKNNLNCIDFLKIDCEGAEYEIIFSINEDNMKKIKQMGGEYHEFISTTGNEYKVNDLTRHLSDYGNVKIIPMQEGIGLIQYTKK
ncbi:MAG: FkbM family methyltransferase [Methanobacterium sp.]